jgi:hypothetical protein
MYGGPKHVGMMGVRETVATVFLKWVARVSARPALGACVLGLCLACLPVASVAVAAANGASLQTGPTSGGQTQQQPVSATLEQCITASSQADRSTTFSGQMETMPGTRRMAMLIVVQERAAGGATFHTLSAPGLGAWQHSEVGVKIYKYVRQVTDLPAPAAFRAVIQFRWLDNQGRVIRRAVRRTPACRQPFGRSQGPQPTPPAAARMP